MHYESLGHWSNKIRLVNILPRDESPSESDEIRCTLEHVSLVNPQPYTALSYCWGDATITEEIFVDGQSFQATRNLYLALRELRRKGYTTLWIDAICINQDDDDERSSQLLRMGAIYRRAEKTVAWLGEEHSGSEKAISLVETLSSQWSVESGKAVEENFRKKRYTAHPAKLATIEASSLKYFLQFLEREYWHRIWITQELALSREVVILCGQSQTTWSKFEAVLQEISQSKSQLSDTPTRSAVVDAKSSSGFNHVLQLQQFRTEIKSDKPVHFLSALFRTKDSLATEMRDKVFAILGLTYNGSAFIAVPSYGQAIGELLVEITMSAIDLSGSLDVVVFLGNSGEAGTRPTWLPNWLNLGLFSNNLGRRCRYLTNNLAFLDWRSGSDRLDPPGTRQKWNASAGLNPSFTFQEASLRVKCHLLDDSFIALSSTFEGSEGSILEGNRSEVRHPFPVEWLSHREYFHTLNSPELDYSTLAILFEVLLCTCTLDPLVHRYLGGPSHNSFSKAIKNAIHDQLYGLKSSGAQRRFPRMSSWFQNNKTFRFEGTTLGEALQVEFRSKDDDIFIEVPAYIHIFENLGYINSMLQFNMRLSVTRRGYLGWADARAQAGDRIAILLGCSVPVILRPRAEGGWCLVGDAIIPGLMNGEGLEDINIGELGYISLY